MICSYARSTVASFAASPLYNICFELYARFTATASASGLTPSVLYGSSFAPAASEDMPPAAARRATLKRARGAEVLRAPQRLGRGDADARVEIDADMVNAIVIRCVCGRACVCDVSIEGREDEARNQVIGYLAREILYVVLRRLINRYALEFWMSVYVYNG